MRWKNEVASFITPMVAAILAVQLTKNMPMDKALICTVVIGAVTGILAGLIRSLARKK